MHCWGRKKSAGSEKIKAKETARAPQKFNWSFTEWAERREMKRRNLWTSKMIEISKDVYLMGRVWCYQFSIFHFFLSRGNCASRNEIYISALLSINRQILMTWQSSNANSLSSTAVLQRRSFMYENRAG